MAVSNQEVAAWLAANPTATDAQIAQAALAAGVSSNQLSQVTGIPVSDIEARITEVLPYVAPPVEERTVDMGEGTRSEYFVKGTNIRVDAPTYTEDYSQGPLTESSTATLRQNNITIYDPKKKGEHVYSPTGQYLGFKEGARDSSLLGAIKEITKETAPIWTAALAANAGSLFGNAGAGAGAAATDASFLAADAAQLASQGLSESTISQVLGASGYASGPAANLAASMAVNGLDAATMTQQLNALSTNTGLMSQTGSAADFAAADALQLKGQVGNNFAAIEQNLIASGVDPLIAADISQQIAFNSGLTQADLATNLANSFGNNIYDVNMATTYPTSTLPGSGGLLSDVTGTGVGTGTGTSTTTTGTGTGLTNTQISNLGKTVVGLAGTTGAVRAVTGGGGTNIPLQTPTQGMPEFTPEYYQQLQQYYNSYLPQTPRDVVTPLQQWYNSKSGA